MVFEATRNNVVRLSPHHGDEVVCGHLGRDVHARVLLPTQQSLDEARLPRGVLT